VFAAEFDSLSDAVKSVSPQNTDALDVVDGALHIRAHAHTHAFLRLPLGTESSGFVVKIRQGDDGGMSWGPAAMLRWEDGSVLRIGTRGDGTLQADISGTQYHGDRHDPGQWVWLRARWLDGMGIVERSDDGAHYETVWRFEHAGEFNQPAAELLVGKVPYNGEPLDHSDPGAVGECSIDFVRVYRDEVGSIAASASTASVASSSK